MLITLIFSAIIQLKINCRLGRAVYPRSSFITTQVSVPPFEIKTIAD